ncbi:NADH-quinone oxidoreductase subunit G [Denitratisoma sp. DHT3]|uniref:NADH-quinone oxidoreductase subunit NuoG n=1 Tax=Denitratisoma sp. DHT3 TaxID=1981880 RepID=UPI0011984EEA|nr:NADH-quinone oxidoreductase subunit NuoG [Denitratisoma sp. DHT3]QDX80863.1 NADH-quinone oxidoreductase subunit G [Denitratisoma sp. DHT3]
MLEIEIDGKALQVQDGSTIIDAAHQAGTYIPHFCYHKKLSIAASCRMCLVEVEKAPKPMPACATPVTNGMKVFTHSSMAVKAQKGVMEFLLINHPLDCPICDQGGECQLQDLAVGYGGAQARYEEEKRVVPNKDLGPLVSTDMTRCINCTRCVRFTQEIAGFQELGQAFRGDRAEIMPFVENTVNSELSGNIIDLCPVGALTSKPFRFSARTWELSRRKSVSPHDGVGANLIVQTKLDRVYRVLPLENEDVNECWLADRDRFSYEALNSDQRLTKPMVKQDGQWREVEWNVALDYVSHALRDVAKTHGGSAIGALISPHATLEEMYLAQKLLRGIGCENIDSRLRQNDFSADGKQQGTPWLGLKIAELSDLDRALVIGSFLRKDQPLLAQRLRRAARRGAQVSVIHSADDDLLMKVFAKAIAAPSRLPEVLAQVLKAAAELKGVGIDASVAAVEVSAEARRIAESLASATNGAVLLGNFAQQHPQAATLAALAQKLAEITGVRFGFLGAAANSVGAYVAQAITAANGPNTGLNARTMLEQPRRAYLLLGVEPELDCADGAAALAAMREAQTVIVMSPFKSQAALDYADVMLPVSPFSETSGTFVNTEGRVQSFHAVVKPQGETRPAWKVLRVLGNLLNQPDFEYDSSEEVRQAVLGGTPEFVSGLGNSQNAVPSLAATGAAAATLERVGEVPLYFADALVRRAPSLQATVDGAAPRAAMSGAALDRIGVAEGATVRVRSGAGEVTLVACLDAGLPEGCVRIPAAHAATVALGAQFGGLVVEKA